MDGAYKRSARLCASPVCPPSPELNGTHLPIGSGCHRANALGYLAYAEPEKRDVSGMIRRPKTRDLRLCGAPMVGHMRLP